MSDHAYEDGTVLYVVGIRDFRERSLIYRGRSPFGDRRHVLETKTGTLIDVPQNSMESLTDDIAFASARSIKHSMLIHGRRWREFVIEEVYELAIKHYPDMFV